MILYLFKNDRFKLVCKPEIVGDPASLERIGGFYVVSVCMVMLFVVSCVPLH